MRRFLLAIAFAGSILASNALQAEIPRKDPPPGDTLQAVLDRIREHAASDNWKQPGWTDEKIEAWLDKLVGSVAKGANYQELKLPLRLADTKASDQPIGRTLSGALIIGKNVDLQRVPLRNCVVLADGNIDAMSAQGSVLVARGTVTIRSISQLSIIVAGTLAKLHIDGAPGNNDSGSLVVSRGWVDLGSSSYGTLVAALEGVGVSRLQGATFINMQVPPGRIDPQGPPSRSISVNDLPLERLPTHALNEKIELLGFLHGRQKPGGGFAPIRRSPFDPLGIVFRYDGRKYVAEIDQPIVDEAGNPVPGLQKWKLAQVMGTLAILSSSDADAVVRMSDR